MLLPSSCRRDLPGALPLPTLEDAVDLAYGQEVTVSLPDSAEADRIRWFLNGEMIDGEGENHLMIGDDLPPGRHTVSAVAEEGALRASENVVLRVHRSPAERVILGRNRGYLLTERGDLYGWGSQYLGILLN